MTPATKSEVRASPGTGEGTFATKAILPGIVILDQCDFIPLVIPLPSGQPSSSEAQVTNAFSSLLSGEQKAAFLALPDLLSASMPQISKLYRIYLSHAHTSAHGSAWLSLRLSKCNHSCAPNAVVMFDRQAGITHLIATRRIAEGEEICTCYHSVCSTMPYSVRRATLRQMSHFTCTCDLCTAPFSEQGISDMPRLLALRLTQLLNALPKYAIERFRYDFLRAKMLEVEWVALEAMALSYMAAGAGLRTQVATEAKDKGIVVLKCAILADAWASTGYGYLKLLKGQDLTGFQEVMEAWEFATQRSMLGPALEFRLCRIEDHLGKAEDTPLLHIVPSVVSGAGLKLQPLTREQWQALRKKMKKG